MIDGFSNCSSVTTPRISPYGHMPNDYEHLAFHIESDDYFLYLSALLSFAEETLASADCSNESTRIQVEAMRSTRKDLQYLHDFFKIEPR